MKKKKAEHVETDPAHQEQGRGLQTETPPPEYLPPPPPPPQAPVSDDGSDPPRDRYIYSGNMKCFKLYRNQTTKLCLQNLKKPKNSIRQTL